MQFDGNEHRRPTDSRLVEDFIELGVRSGEVHHTQRLDQGDRLESAAEPTDTVGEFRSTDDLQLGERLLQSEHASVGDIGAAQDQRVEAGVRFQMLQTGIADIRILEPENLEAAHFYSG